MDPIRHIKFNASIRHARPPGSAGTSNPLALGASWLATLGAAGAGVLALLSASCCVLPLTLGLVGLGGSWLTVLSPLVAWRTPILLGAAMVLALVWALLLRRGLGRAQPRAIAVATLASASLLLAATAPAWELKAQGALIDLSLERRQADGVMAAQGAGR